MVLAHRANLPSVSTLKRLILSGCRLQVSYVACRRKTFEPPMPVMTAAQQVVKTMMVIAALIEIHIAVLS